ncbi:MAG TPA: acetyl-CoA carboxylase biotin carboxyl carrier protein subunit [Bacteroidia bacterium]|nr:acetyl-CoA carboxylase biotin carboxyl carrier protein subunit [Bacteroidia bacterium]HNT79549.1 acetyl-CoA carboxylase biotin carboxyl carrier protein subunit [Bacteroidia bacterium]
MLRVKVNQKASYTIEAENNFFSINGEECSIDIVANGAKEFHILYKGKSAKAYIVEQDTLSKTLSISINGTVYALELRDQYDELLHKLGFDRKAGKKINNLKAPMPGLVLDIKIESGQMVQKGDALLVLEAMKMENILKAESEGQVKTIKVTKGDKVEKNELLIEFV